VALTRRVWTTQPPPGVRLDQGNPLTGGLFFAAHGNSPIELVSGNLITRIDSPGFRSTSAGTGFNTNGTSAFFSSTLRPITLTQWTLVLFTETRTVGFDQRIFGFGNSTDNQPFVAIGAGEAANTRLRVWARSALGAPSNESVISSREAFNSGLSITALRHIGGNLTGFINGRPDGAASGGGLNSPYPVNRVAIGGVLRGSLAAPSAAITFAALAYNRALTDEEIYRLGTPAGIWGLFQPLRRIWVPVSAGGATTVSQDSTAAYTVIGSAQADRAATYAIQAAAQSDRAATYAVQAAAQSDRAGAYVVVGAVQADRAATYAIQASVQADRAATYAVQAAAQSDRAAVYAVTGAVQSDRAAAYAIQSAAQADRPATYAIQAAAQADAAAAYAVVGAVQADRVATYAVQAAAQQDLPAAFDILAAGIVTQSLTAAYVIASSVQSDGIATYGIQAAVEADRAATYAIQAAVEADRAATYAVVGSVQQDLAGTYTLVNAAQRDLDATFTVFAPGGGAGASAAEIAEAVWQRIIESGLTAEQMLRLVAAPLTGTASGVGTETEVYYSRDGSKPRVTATFDAQGNRTSVAVDGSP